jgi:pilus assembly protein CpaF
MNGFEMILPFLKPIERLILDESISEVMVNGASHVFIERNGFIEEVRGLSLGEKSLMIAVKNIARRLGDDICEAKPILDSRLPDGSRVAAVIPPCSLNGVTFTIRKFNSRHFGIDDLVTAGTLERWLANQLEDYVLGRKNILIAGATGCGKTTLLNILGKFIPEEERTVRTELRRHVSEIRMNPQPGNKRPHYVAEGSWDLVGTETGPHTDAALLSIRMVAGACNHPNCLVLPFRMELIRLVA